MDVNTIASAQMILLMRCHVKDQVLPFFDNTGDDYTINTASHCKIQP